MSETVVNASSAGDPAIWRQTLGDLLRRTAARLPDKPAIICGDTHWTYAQFDRICNRLAHGLAARGVVVGEHVAVLSRNSHAFAALRFALARLGAVLVPINFMLNAEEVAYILRHCGASRLLMGSDLVDLAKAAAGLDTPVKELFWLPTESDGGPAAAHDANGGQAGKADKADNAASAGLTRFDELLASSDAEPDVAIDGRSVLQIIYTSGTESMPKGAMLSHDAVIWQYTSCIVEGSIAQDDLMLHALPLYHCAQLDVFLGPGVYVGATNIITSTPTPDNILDLLQRHRVNSFFAPPSIWIALMRAPAFDATDLSTLAKGYYGASIMPVEVLRELASRLPALSLWNFYGQTEIAPLATVLKPHEQLSRAGSAGRAALNVETRVVDDAMNDVAPGEIGEIVHRSPQLLNGYYNDAERTAAAFAGGWFHSGDLAMRDEHGYITVVDRKKDMIKTGGENVASRDVEEAIYSAPGVSEVAVIGLSHPYWIEAVTAVVVRKPGVALDEAQLLTHCRDKLAGFKVPKQVVFVDSLPKNPSGKLLKRDLRVRFAKLYAEK